MSEKAFRAAIVGAGPAGIATAVELTHRGVSPREIAIFEKGPALIEAIRKFYPEKKMTIANYKGLPTETVGHLTTFPDLTKEETLEYFDELTRKYELTVRFSSEVFKVQKTGSHFQIGAATSIFEAEKVFVGIGILGRPNKPDYKLPATLKANLLFDLTSQKIANEKVLVVGGGDTSADYVDALLQEGCTVALACRAPNTSRMMDSNSEKVRILSEGKKLNLRLSCTVTEILDLEGKPQVKFSNGEPEVFDRVVFALGGTTPLNFLKSIGVECDATWPKYGSKGETNIDGLYLIGDLVAGKTGGSIITAYNSAFHAVSHAFLA